MSKFSLRKVLAVGVAAALGVSGFVGLSAPANAATLTNSNANVTYTGTGLKMLEGTDFLVTASINSAVSYWTNGANGYEHTSAPVYKYTYQQWQDDPDAGDAGTWIGSETYSYGPTDLTANIVVPNDLTPSALQYLKAVTLVSTATTIKWEASSKGVVAGTTSATLTVESITADTDVTYTPYVSNDNDAVRDADEPQGPALTISWVNYVEADWSTVVSHVKDGQSSADITATLVPKAGTTGWNTTQHDDDISFKVYKNGIDFETWTGNTSALADSTGGQNEGLGSYTARAYITGTSTTWIGAVSAADNVQFEFAAKQVHSVGINDQASANVNTDGYIREGVKSMNVTATVRDQFGSPVARAGIPVKFYVNVYDTTSTVTFNGKAVANDDGAVLVSAVTDASGVATVAVTSSAGVDGEGFDIYAEVVSYDGDYVSSGSYNYEWDEVVANAIYESHDAGYGAVINSMNGKTYTLSWTVTDNFGEVFTAGSHRLAVSIDGAGDVYAPLVNGKASYTVTESLFANDNYAVYAELEVRDSATSPNYSDVGNLSTLTSVYVVANDSASKLDVVSYSSAMDVNYDAFKTHNFVLSENTLFDGWDTDGSDVIWVEGNVVNANGDLLPGARVELRGNGSFATNANGFGILATFDEELYSDNSIVVYTDSSGFYGAYFATHKSGNVTITASSGSANDSFVVSVNDPSPYSADNIRISAPKSIKAGRSVSAEVSVVDVWGNVVAAPSFDSNPKLEVTTNRGLVSVSTPAGIDTASYQVKVLLQTLDRGPVLINANWSMFFGPGTQVTATKAVWSGPAVNATAGAKKGRVIVEAYRAVGQTVNVFVGKTKVASFVPDAANDRFVVKGIKSGNRKVSVKVTPGYDFAGVISVK